MFLPCPPLPKGASCTFTTFRFSPAFCRGCGLCQMSAGGRTYLFTRFTVYYSKILVETFISQGVLRIVMARGCLLISDRYPGSTGFFARLQVGLEGVRSVLSFMSSCCLFSLHVARDFVPLKCPVHAKSPASRGRCAVRGQCRTSCSAWSQRGGHGAHCRMVWCPQGDGGDVLAMSAGPLELPAQHCLCYRCHGEAGVLTSLLLSPLSDKQAKRKQALT